MGGAGGESLAQWLSLGWCEVLVESPPALPKLAGGRNNGVVVVSPLPGDKQKTGKTWAKEPGVWRGVAANREIGVPGALFGQEIPHGLGGIKDVEAFAA